MRIAIVLGAFNAGGVQTFVLRLARYLRNRGNELEFILVENRGVWFDDVVKEFPVHFLDPQQSFTNWSFAHKVGGFLAGQKYEVVLLNHVRFAQAALSYLDKATVVIPVIHNDVPNIYRVACGNPEQWNCIVSDGDKVWETSRKQYTSKPNVLIYYGVDLPTKEADRPAPGGNAPLKLLFSGAIEHDRKGCLDLAPIVKHCLDMGFDVRIDVVGDGPDRGRLESRFRDEGIADVASFLGILASSENYHAFLSHHVLVMPSRWEGFPITPLEAQACGCVPIATHLPGITDAGIVDGVTGFLLPLGDTEAFARRIAELANDPVQWAEMSRAGQQHVRERFSVEVMGRQYLELFEDVRRGKYDSRAGRRRFGRIDHEMLAWRDYLPHGWLGDLLHKPVQWASRWMRRSRSAS